MDKNMEKWVVGKTINDRQIGSGGGYSEGPPEGEEEEKSSLESGHDAESIVGVFNPCCCDCSGRCDLRRWCLWISGYGIIVYSVAIILFVTLLHVTKEKDFDEYFSQFENSPDFNEDLAFTFQGFCNTLQILISISAVMLVGYFFLLAATQIRRRWARFLCLGLPIATPGSIIIQIVLYFIFQIERTGTVVNYLLVLDVYFAMCAFGLYTTLKAQEIMVVEEKESDLIEFPDFPPDRIPDLPLAYLTNKRVESLRQKSRVSINASVGQKKSPWKEQDKKDMKYIMKPQRDKLEYS